MLIILALEVGLVISHITDPLRKILSVYFKPATMMADAKDNLKEGGLLYLRLVDKYRAVIIKERDRDLNIGKSKLEVLRINIHGIPPQITNQEIQDALDAKVPKHSNLSIITADEVSHGAVAVNFVVHSQKYLHIFASKEAKLCKLEEFVINYNL